MPKRAASELNPFWVDFFLNLPRGWPQKAPPTLGFIPLSLWDSSFETVSKRDPGRNYHTKEYAN